MATSSPEISFELDSTFLAEKYDEVSERQYNHGKLLIRDLGIKAGHHVLDIGTGTGRLAEYVADITGPQGKFIGIDPLPLRIEIRLSGMGKLLDLIRLGGTPRGALAIKQQDADDRTERGGAEPERGSGIAQILD